MTERAKRAAAELNRRGWQMDSTGDGILDRGCTRCGYQMKADSRFCQNCGAKVEFVADQSSIDDIEAAIKAAEETGQ